MKKLIMYASVAMLATTFAGCHHGRHHHHHHGQYRDVPPPIVNGAPVRPAPAPAHVPPPIPPPVVVRPR